MNLFFRLIALSFLISPMLLGQEKPPAPLSPAAAESRGSSEGTAKLPVRRVVLYKNGVGYFEHLGLVHGSQDVHIDFTSAQLNDVLKSLTVLDLSGGRITGVDYNSEAPLARRLAALRLALGERPTQSEFLGALRGARLEVRSGTAAAITGKLLSVERKTRTGTTFAVETDEISLITDSGEVRSVDLNPATSIRILDHDLQVEVSRYLGLVAAARDQDVRRMTISTTGAGDRNLYVSYISEVPIWKTTYRIVLPAKAEKKPLLQGWAIGSAGGVMGGVVGGMPPPVPPPSSIEMAREMSNAAASGQELGDLFEYKLKDRVTLKKNQSALVPIAQTDIQAEKVSLWSGNFGSGRPLRALWVKNTSPLTFDGGSFSVLENEVFAGEGLTDSIKPGERR
jgi:hypothetical protein